MPTTLPLPHVLLPEPESVSSARPRGRPRQFTEPRSCPVCQRIFSNGFNLKRHLVIHNKDKPYACGKCSRAFNHPSNCKTHESTCRKAMRPQELADSDPSVDDDKDHDGRYDSGIAPRSSLVDLLCAAAAAATTAALTDQLALQHRAQSAARMLPPPLLYMPVLRTEFPAQAWLRC